MTRFDIPAWIFVIDTDTYAGSFERQLTAWVTGQIGDCGVGEEFGELAREQLPEETLIWFDENIIQCADELGCHRPTSIWPTPGWFNDGYGNHWKEDSDPEEVRKAHQEAVSKHTRPEEIMEKPGHFEAFQSVAIFLNVKPTTEISTLMMDRIRTFSGYRSKVEVVGFRLIRQQVMKIEEILVESARSEP